MQRITRICFSLSVPEAWSESGSDRLKKFEFVEGPMRNGECIESLWFDLTSEFINIMMRVTPPGHQAELNHSLRKVVEGLRSGKAIVTKSDVKTNIDDFTLKTIDTILRFEMEDALRNMHACVKSIEERRTIYKVSDLVGPIELTSYLPLAEFEGMRAEN